MDWTEHLTIEGSRKRVKHVGVLAVDLDTFRTRYERGRPFLTDRARDPLGRVYEWRFVEGYVLIVTRPDGNEREFLREEAWVGNLTLCVEGSTTWAFYIRIPRTSYPGGRRVTTGEYALVRVHGGTGETKDIPLPDGYV